MRDGFIHCKPRTMRVVEIRTNDRYNVGPWGAGQTLNAEQQAVADKMANTSTIVLQEDDNPAASYITLSVKTANISKFPNVGDTISADITLNAIGA